MTNTTETAHDKTLAALSKPKLAESIAKLCYNRCMAMDNSSASTAKTRVTTTTHNPKRLPSTIKQFHTFNN